MEIYLKNSRELGSGNQVNVVKLTSPDTNDVFKLPDDVLISLNGSKMINERQILDGVTVFERVTRKAFEIDLEFTFREIITNQPTSTLAGITFNRAATSFWVFPTTLVTEFFQQVWKKDAVLQVENIFLNSLDIKNLVIKDVQITTVRGSIDVPIKLKCTEDFYSVKNQGNSLII